MTLSNPLQIQQKIKKLGFRWTRPRQQVIEIFSRHDQPFTIQDVFGKLGGKKTDLVSVYRSVNLFLKHGVLVTVDSVAEGKRYELSDEYRSHHHHVICQACGEVKDIHDCGLEKLEAGIAKETGFKILRHDLKFMGLCRRCR
jgi:Fur family ferric uptake transcriptional regulator